MFPPNDAASGYRDIAGGLNLMRYSEFLRHVADTGWRFDYLAVNTFLNRLPPLRFICDMVMRVPVVRDYFAHNVYAVLRAQLEIEAGLPLRKRSLIRSDYFPSVATTRASTSLFYALSEYG